MSIQSPRGRTLSDSMDYDDELAELHDRRQSSFGIDVGYRCPSPETSRYNDRKQPLDSDEDTEDASEDGEERQTIDEHQEIKEQVYYDKLGLLKTNLEELEGGNHTEYNRRLTRVEKEVKHRIRINEAFRDYEYECIEKEYANERLLAAREFEDKKIELRENIVNELEEKKKQVEQERFSMELTSDLTEVKPMSTRKLRRRPNEPVPIPEKRRKTPQSQITFLLEEGEIDEDLKSIAKGNFKESIYAKPSKSGSKSEAMIDSAPPPLAPLVMEAKIVDGKLFYEKRWFEQKISPTDFRLLQKSLRQKNDLIISGAKGFHRGQPVFVEGKDTPRTSGIISGINQDLVWVRKLNEQTKIKVPIAYLQKGKMVIKRRA